MDGKPAGLALWALFGTTNQLLAGLTLTLVTLYLKRLSRPAWPTAIPAVFIMSSTLSAMAVNLRTFAVGESRGRAIVAGRDDAAVLHEDRAGAQAVAGGAHRHDLGEALVPPATAHGIGSGLCGLRGIEDR